MVQKVVPKVVLLHTPGRPYPGLQEVPTETPADHRGLDTAFGLPSLSVPCPTCPAYPALPTLLYTTVSCCTPPSPARTPAGYTAWVHRLGKAREAWTTLGSLESGKRAGIGQNGQNRAKEQESGKAARIVTFNGGELVYRARYCPALYTPCCTPRPASLRLTSSVKVAVLGV